MVELFFSYSTDLTFIIQINFVNAKIKTGKVYNHIHILHGISQFFEFFCVQRHFWIQNALVGFCSSCFAGISFDDCKFSSNFCLLDSKTKNTNFE